MDLITNTIYIHITLPTGQVNCVILFSLFLFHLATIIIMNCIAELPVRYALLQALSNLNPIWNGCFWLNLKFDLSIVTVTSCPYAHAVVIWCDCVGGIQWRKDSLPCRGPVVPHPAAGGGAETQETYQPSLCHRDVSVHSWVLLSIIYIRQQ